MVRLYFYGGVKEIGGNKILLEDRGTKILLDFGMSFQKRRKYFEEFLTPRTANGIGDFLVMGLIPDIKGIYREDLLEHFGRKAMEPEVAAVILSHAHADHANYISFLHKDIPVYCGETCKLILDAVAEQSQRSIENEVIDFKERPLFKKDYRKKPISRNFKIFKTGDKIKIDSLEIEPIHVDHCLAGDTKIVENGELKEVKEAPTYSFLMAFDFYTKTLVKAFAIKREHTVSQIFRIKTRFGEIETSSEHRFFANGREKRARDLKKGDLLFYFKGKKCENAKVESIKIVEKRATVYDFEVPGYYNLIANGFLVHNSVPGSYGFIIHTSKGPIVYTGDLRMHGLHSHMTQDFMEVARESRPIAMITEGTRINKQKTDESEKKVYEKSKKEIEKCKNFTIVDFNFKDLDRFNTFYKIARDLGKKMVISFRHACFLERYHRKLNAPNSTDDFIMLLKPKRLTGTYINEDYTERYIKDRLDYPNIILAEDIVKKPEDYIIILNFWYFNTLIDLKPKGGLYIHSLSEPFNEEMEISFERMMNWLRFFNLRFVQSHCSGHICGSELRELIKNVNPKLLFPIHTENPGMFRKILKTKMVREGKAYKL